MNHHKIEQNKSFKTIHAMRLYADGTAGRGGEAWVTEYGDLGEPGNSPASMAYSWTKMRSCDLYS